MNTKRCVCWFCLGQESARIWSKWLAWVCAWQVSRERAGKSRGEFQEVAKAFHFGFRLKISVFWKAHSCPLLTFDLCSPGRGSTCVTPSSVRSCSSWAGELRCPGLKASDRQVQSHTHIPFLYGVLAIHAFLVFTVKWYRDNPDFWSDISEDQPPIRREFEKATTVVPISSESWLTGRDFLIFFPYK